MPIIVELAEPLRNRMYIILLVILYIKRRAIKDWFIRRYGPNCWPTNRKLFVYTAIAGLVCGVVYAVSELSADSGKDSDAIAKIFTFGYMLGALYYIARCYMQTKTSADKREIRCRYWLTAGFGFLIFVVTATAVIWALLLVIIFFILRFVNVATGFFPGVPNTSVSAPSVPLPDDNGSVDRPYAPMMGAADGDDGGIMDGNTRVPLHDNGDGTMSDDRGNLYKRDGNDVMKL